MKTLVHVLILVFSFSFSSRSIQAAVTGHAQQRRYTVER